jgi:hypothetical protein
MGYFARFKNQSLVTLYVVITSSPSSKLESPFHKKNKINIRISVCSWLPSGNDYLFAFEHGRVEIVDLPIYSMVIFHSYVM